MVPPDRSGRQEATPPADEVLRRSALFLLGIVANRLSTSGSQLCRRWFGIGFGGWRLMLILALEPGATAKRMREVLGLDKAAVSRDLRSLEQAGLAAPTPESAGRRSRGYVLTARGRALHARINQVSIRQERQLLAGLGPGEEAVLVDMLQRLLGQLPEIESFQPTEPGP
jgi:DNA-binding MarR family transcriptional regulator